MGLFKLNQGAKLPIACPKCGHKQEELLTRLKNSPQITCGGCGGLINVDGAQLKALLDALGA